MNLQIYFSLKIHNADLAISTHQKFCLICGFQRDLPIHIPPHKSKTVQTTTFIWVYFLQMTRQLLTMKTLPRCFNQFKKLRRWKDTIFPIIYFIKYSRGGFGMSESGNSCTSSSTSSITLFLPFLPLYDKVISPVTHH